MKYLSIDIETTGLDYKVNQLIEIGVVLADTNDNSVPVENLPGLRILIPHDQYVINTYCMKLHEKLWPELNAAAKALKDSGVYSTKMTSVTYASAPGHIEYVLRDWFREVDFDAGVLGKRLTVAGKNFFGFDHKFLAPVLPEVKFHHRYIDPVMLFAKPDDHQLPDLKECCKRAGIQLEGYHTAVGDAQTVVKLVRCGLVA